MKQHFAVPQEQQQKVAAATTTKLIPTPVEAPFMYFGPAPVLEVENNKEDMRSSEAGHPFWLCKREGCSGMLTLIGNEKHHIKDVENARRRAAWRRVQYPATKIHGSPMSCSVCGDRPMLKSRRSAWQRLCVICMEPYAMNGFWCKHGGPNSRGVSTKLDIRSNGHKNYMRRMASDNVSIQNMEKSLCLEQKWLMLANQGKIDALKDDISNAVLLKHLPDDREVLESSIDNVKKNTENSSSSSLQKQDQDTKKRKREAEPVVAVAVGVVVDAVPKNEEAGTVVLEKNGNAERPTKISKFEELTE